MSTTWEIYTLKCQTNYFSMCNKFPDNVKHKKLIHWSVCDIMCGDVQWAMCSTKLNMTCSNLYIGLT